MEIPKVETFEQNIASEIRQKEASIEDIASASGTIGNDAVDNGAKKNQSILISVITILTLCGLVGAGYIGYIYYSDDSSNITLETVKKEEKNKNTLPVSSISPKLAQMVGMSLGGAEKVPAGFIIDINKYSPVFSYMIRNEAEFANELGEAIGNKRTIKTASTSTQQVPQQATTTMNASTTSIINGSSTASTTTPIHSVDVVSVPEEYIFSDITISNQNMRIATSIHGTLVYAFIGERNLAISSSTNGILALRSKILQK